MNGGFKYEIRYDAWGAQRYSSGTVGTTLQYTDQRKEASLGGSSGLYFYNARYYDPYITRFTQPDTIIPNPYDPQSYDRYSYVRNNPVNRVDPSGHFDNCSAITDRQCAVDNGWTSGLVKSWITAKYGITMSDEGAKAWDKQNLILMYSSLGNVDSAINGHLQSFANGTTITLGNHVPTQLPNGSWTSYDGWTSSAHAIAFNTMGTDAIRQMNIYHEFGHLIDLRINSEFTNDIAAIPNGQNTWVTNGYVNTTALVTDRVPDPNYGTAQAIQASGPRAEEQWADGFANFVAGNINWVNPLTPGPAMYNAVAIALSPYIW